MNDLEEKMEKWASIWQHRGFVENHEKIFKKFKKKKQDRTRQEVNSDIWIIEDMTLWI